MVSLCTHIHTCSFDAPVYAVVAVMFCLAMLQL